MFGVAIVSYFNVIVLLKEVLGAFRLLNRLSLRSMEAWNLTYCQVSFHFISIVKQILDYFTLTDLVLL